MTDGLRPHSTRPHMPGYGIQPAGAGSGLLPWEWATTRLSASHDYWLATVWPDGRPHLMPVWGAWDGEAVWFSSALRSRKVRNIAAGSAITLSTEDARNPVVVEGSAEIIAESQALQRFLDAMNDKYDVSYTMDFMDPEKNATVRVRPVWAFGLADGDFSGSPTRWGFDS